MKLSEITKKGSVSLVLQFLGMALSLCLTLYMTRKTGTEGYNAYALSFSWITFLAHISLLGFDSLLTREMNKSINSPESKRGLIRKGALLGLSTSVLLALGLFAFAWLFYSNLSDANNAYIQPALLISAAGVPLFAMLLLAKSFLKGIKKNEVGMIPESLVRPGLLFIGLIVLLVFWTDIHPAWIIILNVGAILVALIVSLFISRKHRIRSESSPAFDQKFWKPAVTFLFLSFVMMTNSRADLIMLGFWEHTLPEVGTYSLALKLTDFVSMPLLVLNAVIAPYLVEFSKTEVKQGT